MVWDDWPGSGSTHEKGAHEMKTPSATRAGLAIGAVCGRCPSVSSPFPCCHPETTYIVVRSFCLCALTQWPPAHSLRTCPGQGSSFNSGHLLLLSIAKLFVMSHFLNVFALHCRQSYSTVQHEACCQHCSTLLLLDHIFSTCLCPTVCVTKQPQRQLIPPPPHGDIISFNTYFQTLWSLNKYSIHWWNEC